MGCLFFATTSHLLPRRRLRQKWLEEKERLSFGDTEGSGTPGIPRSLTSSRETNPNLPGPESELPHTPPASQDWPGPDSRHKAVCAVAGGGWAGQRLTPTLSSPPLPQEMQQPLSSSETTGKKGGERSLEGPPRPVGGRGFPPFPLLGLLAGN